jgi:hypothetical protein
MHVVEWFEEEVKITKKRSKKRGQDQPRRYIIKNKKLKTYQD